MTGENKKTYYIALGGLIAAASAALMFFSAVFPMTRFVFPALSGVLLICAVCEMGESRAFLIYAAVGVLSLLLPSSKTAAVFYIFFLGLYPILKSFFERIKNKPLQWLVKIVVFNACAAGSLAIVVFLMDVSLKFLKYGYLPLILVLNAAFILYDIALSGLVTLYMTRIRKILKKR